MVKRHVILVHAQSPIIQSGEQTVVNLKLLSEHENLWRKLMGNLRLLLKSVLNLVKKMLCNDGAEGR